MVSGIVETGWRLIAAKAVPYSAGSCLAVTVTCATTRIGIDRGPLQITEAIDFDLQTAVINCVWFKQPTPNAGWSHAADRG
jgi:hypothetical protein